MNNSPDLLASSYQAQIDPNDIRPNPNNPRRYFNEERLDLLRTSIQEVGILVPLIVYADPSEPDAFVLMDGERRWRCASDLGLLSVPVNVIPAPNPLDNLLRMFNIHNVREDWPLISVALSLREVMRISEESGEKRISEMTGVTRSTVRRAKRILSLPENEIDMIRNEAHLDRADQVH
ncbi:ParB/RepB/Spo0J family partition protein [Curtobacterium flaccumfaciens]|nr:ParB/RepB/Spo0J family partition protein [Curtobacterium flaccumfaciens]